jgi:uncharacterized protein YaiE (UPF0345 family)
MNKNKAFLTFQIFSSAFQILMKNIKFNEVSVNAKANIYFDGKVVSHSVVLSDGAQKTLGLIYPGSYHFNTELAEKMEIIAGTCNVKLDGSEESNSYGENQSFHVPANSGFTIEVNEGICEYICSFID